MPFEQDYRTHVYKYHRMECKNDRNQRMKSLRERVQADPPLLIMVMGVPGVGKTTFSKALLQQIAAVYLDNNFIADAFFSDTRTDDAYIQLRDGFYRAMYRIAEENLRVGNTVL